MLALMGKPRATVVVPVKDRRERMLRCLDAVVALDFDDFDVLVLDNGSTDGTLEACREYARGARVPIRVEQIGGTIGRVRNRGAELARGELVAFTDSDCAPAPGWLSVASAALRDDPALGVVCGRTIPEGPPERGWPATIDVDELTWRFESCNVVYRRAALTASQGFDESGFGWEDVAAGWAVLRAGWRAAYVREAVVCHDVTYPGFAWHLRRVQQHRFAAAVLRRYPEARDKLLHRKVFLDDRHPVLYLALAGLVLAPRRPVALALALPYAQRRLPRSDVKAAGQGVLLDVARAFAVARGAVAHRTLVL